MRIHLVRGDGHHIGRAALGHRALIDDLHRVIVGNLRNVIDLMLNLKNNVEPYRAGSFPMMVYYDEDATLENDEFPKFREELKSTGIEELLSCCAPLMRTIWPPGSKN